MKKEIELPIIEEPKEYYHELEMRLKKFFRENIYIPLLQEFNLSKKTLKNAKNKDPLLEALFQGRVFYSQGAFRGEFNANISKKLKDLGATFDKKTSSFKIEQSKLDMQTRQMISSSEYNLNEKLREIDKKLAAIVPEELAANFKAEDIFDKTLWKADKSFQKNVQKISVDPKLTAEQRAKISKEWQDNMKLYIRDWSEEQIKDLRKNIYEGITSGARRESFVAPILKITKTIQGSYDQAVNKAKFLAHQESRLMMATYKQVRYEQAGSKSYIWRCVHRPHDMDPKHHIPGNVRYSHGLLDGKEYKWSDPPVITNPGQPVRRGHPGTDYNCRCHAKPLIRVNA